MKDQLRFGAAKNCITPDKTLLPRLFDLAEKNFSQVHDDLYVRCMYFESGHDKALFVSFDLDKAPYPVEWVREISETTGIPGVNILYIGIHAHSVPVTGFRPFEPYHDVSKKAPEIQRVFREYESFVKERLFKTVQEAVSSTKAARTGFGRSECFININRIQRYSVRQSDGSRAVVCGEGINGDRPVNHTVYVFKIEDLGGKPLGFFINYAVHGVVMFGSDTGDGTTAVSGDIGGTVSAGIEAEYPGAVAMWSSGAAGDVNPIMRTELLYPDPVSGDTKSARIKTLDASAAMLDFIAGNHLAAVRNALRNAALTGSDSSIGAVEEFSLTPPRKEGDAPYKIRLHLIRIGSAAIMGINGELYTSHALKIQETALLKNTIVVNHDSSLVEDNPAYIFDDETIRWCEGAGKIAIPGRNFRGQAGVIEQSLAEHTKSMFNSVL